MTLDAARFQKLLSEFKLELLFNELGWDRPTRKPHTVSANGETFTLTPLAHKRGVVVFRCSPDTANSGPTLAATPTAAMSASCFALPWRASSTIVLQLLGVS